MSFSKLNSAEMDLAFAEMYAELDNNIRIPSATKINNPISSSKISSKRTSTSATVNSDTKFRKLDDEDASQFLLQKQLEEMEDELFAQYIAPANSQVLECDITDDIAIADIDEVEDPIPSCLSCLPSCSSSMTAKRFKSTDNDLKNYSFGIPRLSMAKCSSTCHLGGTCVQLTTIQDMETMVIDFWDDADCAAPSSETRRLKILDILRRSFQPNKQEFHFYAGCKDKDNREVCEAAYLILLGLSNSPHVSKAPGQWKRAKAHIFKGKDAAGIKYSAAEEDKLLKAEGKSNKYNSAVTFIQYFAKEFGDTIPGAEGKYYLLYCL